VSLSAVQILIVSSRLTSPEHDANLRPWARTGRGAKVICAQRYGAAASPRANPIGAHIADPTRPSRRQRAKPFRRVKRRRFRHDCAHPPSAQRVRRCPRSKRWRWRRPTPPPGSVRSARRRRSAIRRCVAPTFSPICPLSHSTALQFCSGPAQPRSRDRRAKSRRHKPARSP